MGRPKKDIGSTGLLLCKGCEELKHISEYYCSGPPYYCIVEDGVDTWYSKPMSRCKDCVKGYYKDRGRTKVLENILTRSEEDIAFREAYYMMRSRGQRLVRDPDGSYRAYPSDDILDLDY